MDQKKLWQQYQSLPADAQRQVVDFLTFLQSKYGIPTRSARSRSDLSQEAFVGIWRNRSDLHDANAWIRKLRKEEWREREHEHDR